MTNDATEATDETLEAVAIALHKKWMETHPAAQQLPWDEIPEQGRVYGRGLARASIEAMRENDALFRKLAELEIEHGN